jgi:hypothetical protein
MAIERLWQRIEPVNFTADGGENGTVTVDSVGCFKVKQKVVISAVGLPDLVLQVKKIPSYTTILVGPFNKKNNPNDRDQSLKTRTNISAYTVALVSNIRAAEQKRYHIDPKFIMEWAYEREPAVALRNLLVDKVGFPISANNPLPTISQLSGPNRQRIQNISVVTANSEFEITLPDGVKCYSIKIRDGESTARIAFASGKTSGAGAEYTKLRRGAILISGSLDLPDNSKLYVQAAKVGAVFEVITDYIV